MYQALGQIGNAQQDLQTYLSLNPYDATIWYESGRLYRVQNDNPNALKALNQAIQLDPQRGLYFLERARVNAVLGQKAQARSDLANAERLGAEIDSQTRAAVQ